VEKTYRRIPSKESKSDKGNPGTIARGRLRKVVGETILKDLEVNSLSIDMISDNKLWCCLIHVANPT